MSYNRWMPVQCSSELYHFGIKGMRWGVRRYQNKDGTLTPKGKKRLVALYDANKFGKQQIEREAEASIQQIKNAGIKEGVDYDVIPKGTHLGRYTSNAEENVGSRRKYAFVTQHDEEAYAFWMKTGKLMAESAENYHLDMVAKKDLKVAKGKEVVEYLIDSMEQAVGPDNVHLRQMKAFFDAEEIAPGFRRMDTSKLSKKDRAFIEYLDEGQKLYRVLNSQAVAKDTPVSSATFDHFKAKGYDAIVDMEDKLGSSDYPIILLNPEESVTLNDRIRFI